MEGEELLILLNQIIYPIKFQNKNSCKEKLAGKLELKLSKKGKRFVDRYLFSKSKLPFSGVDAEYTDLQRYMEGKETILFEKFPMELRSLSKVLKNIGKPNPTKLSNINKDAKENPVYWFLKEMQEPSEKYFKDGNSFHSVVHYLTIKHSDYFKETNKENAFERSEGGDIILAMKEGAIHDLEKSFINRGPLIGKTYSRDIGNIVSKMITPNRYKYLSILSKEFYKNPESDEIIEFVNSLPDNTWFDDEISLISDELKEFEFYNKKYNPNYKTLKEYAEEIKKNKPSEVQDNLPF